MDMKAVTMAFIAKARYKIALQRGRRKARIRAFRGTGQKLLDKKAPMNIHDKAPDFTLQDENGKEVSLKDLRGKTVVLYFFPRADTPG
jgi:cytochrome oxidase Cu insertion factor (SCO1/SenC/PrrC family)